MSDFKSLLDCIKELEGYLAVETSPGKFEEVREFPAEPEIVREESRPSEFELGFAETAQSIAFMKEELERAGFTPHQAFELTKILVEGISK